MATSCQNTRRWPVKSMSTVGCAHAEVGLPTTWVKTTSQKTKPISYGQPMAIFFQGFTGQIVIFHQPCRLVNSSLWERWCCYASCHYSSWIFLHHPFPPQIAISTPSVNLRRPNGMIMGQLILSCIYLPRLPIYKGKSLRVCPSTSTCNPKLRSGVEPNLSRLEYTSSKHKWSWTRWSISHTK